MVCMLSNQMTLFDPSTTSLPISWGYYIQGLYPNATSDSNLFSSPAGSSSPPWLERKIGHGHNTRLCHCSRDWRNYWIFRNPCCLTIRQIHFLLLHWNTCYFGPCSKQAITGTHFNAGSKNPCRCNAGIDCNGINLNRSFLTVKWWNARSPLLPSLAVACCVPF